MSTSRSRFCRLFQSGILFCIAVGCTSTTPEQKQKKPRLSSDDQAEALAHFSFGLLSETSGDANTALDHFQKAIRIDPEETVLYPPAIASALQSKQDDKALELCRELRKKQPEALSPLLLHAHVCVLTDHFDDAESLLRKAVQQFPDEPESRLALARFLISMEQQEEAVGILEYLSQQDPDNADTLSLLGTLYIERARSLKDNANVKSAVLEGINLLEQALELAPDDPAQWQRLGFSYLAIHDMDGVQRAFENAYKLAPNDVLIGRQLLDLYIQKGKIEPALEVCDELIRQTRTDPELWIRYLSERLPEKNRQDLTDYLQDYIDNHSDAPVFYHIQLGSLFLDQDQVDKAEDVLIQADSLFPGDLRLQTITAYLMVRKEQYKDAYVLFQNVLGKESDAEWLNSPFFTISFVTAAQKSGHVEEAAKALGQAFEKDPAVLAGYMRLLFSENTAVSSEEAVQLLEQFKSLYPNEAEPFYYLTILQADLTDYENALLSAQQFEALAPGSNSTNLLNGFFYYQYGIIRERTGQLDEAEVLFRKAIELGTPTTISSAQNYIAYMWAERGEKLDMGLQLIQQALESDPDNAAFIDTLGWIYYMRGDYEKALIQLKKASEQINDDPVIWEHLGDTYLKLSNPCDAVKHWRKALELAPDNTWLAEQIEEHSIKSDECLESADTPEGTPNHP